MNHIILGTREATYQALDAMEKRTTVTIFGLPFNVVHVEWQDNPFVARAELRALVVPMLVDVGYPRTRKVTP